MNKNGKFNRELEVMKKKQIEILELKYTVKEMKNAIVSIDIRFDQALERIREIKDRLFEIIQIEANTEIRMNKSEKNLH